MTLHEQLGSRAYIIAEAGVNHNGDLERALALIDAAAEARADAVKFQSFRTAAMTSESAPVAEYQRASTEAQSQRELLLQLELSPDDHHRLKRHCHKRGVEFMSTPFDLESLALLTDEVGVNVVKLSSGDLTNGPLLLATARTGQPAIVSTGMATLAEIEEALAVMSYGYANRHEPQSTADILGFYREGGRSVLDGKVVLLHCTSRYPTPPDAINLRAMETLRAAHGLPVGLSDHSQGIEVAAAAVARGAAVVEKHFTLDRNLPGPDHQASLEPGELAEMVRVIRVVEQALGAAEKRPDAGELEIARVARKSLVANVLIRKGEAFTTANLTSKRPGTGVSPLRYWDVIGRIATRDYQPDEPIEL